MKPVISKDHCRNCGECEVICPYDVFTIRDREVIVTAPEECIECLACFDGCPEGAITMEE